VVQDVRNGRAQVARFVDGVKGTFKALAVAVAVGS